MTAREDRDRVLRELKERRMFPSQAEQLQIRAQAQRLAREVCHLEGEARRRNVDLERRYRELALKARRQPVEWPDE